MGTITTIFGNHEVPDELADAQRALDAQLYHTVDLINGLARHPHYTDDCGEYLRAALELSADLMSARENGLEDLYARLLDLATIIDVHVYGPDDTDIIYKVHEDYACDGVSGAVSDFCTKYGHSASQRPSLTEETMLTEMTDRLD